MASVRFGIDDYAPPDYVDASDGGETGGRYLNPNPSGSVTSPGRPVATQPESYPTSSWWQDAAHPPQPQDPYYADWQRTNPTNPAAQAPAVGPQLGAAPTGSGFNASQARGWWQQAYGDKPFNEGYWAGVWPSLVARGQQLGDPDYAMKRVMGYGAGGSDVATAGPYANGVGYSLAPSGSPTKNAPAAYSGGNPGGYDDPSSVAFLNEVMDRLNDLKGQHNAIDPFQSLLQLFSLNRVNDLGGAPYTAGEDAALRTRYLEPLTQARDQGRQMNRERISARGMLPSSGLLDVLDRGTEQGYERAVGQGANDTAIRAIDEKQRRAEEQLAILASLLNVSRSSQDRNNAIGREIVSTAETFPNFDNQRLSQLLQASGEGASSPSSILSGVTGLGGLGLNASNSAYNQNANSASAWGQILGYLLTHANG